MLRLPFALPCAGAALAGGRRAVVGAGSVRSSFRGAAAPPGARLARLARPREAHEPPDREVLGPLGHDSFVTLDEGAALPAREVAARRSACVALPVRVRAPMATAHGPAPTVGAGVVCQGGRPPLFLEHVRGTRSRRARLDKLGGSYTFLATGRYAEDSGGFPTLLVATASHGGRDRRTGAARASASRPAHAPVGQSARTAQAYLAARPEHRTRPLPAGERAAERGHRRAHSVPHRADRPRAGAATRRA